MRAALALFALTYLAGAASLTDRAPLEVRLETPLTSYRMRAGTPFRCVVLRDFRRGGRVVIPQGSAVYGTVRKATSVGIGLRHERAALLLSFDSYEIPGGPRLPLTAQLASIDNAREQIGKQGQIRGVLAANNPGNLLNGFWARPSSNIALRSLIGLTGAANQIWARYSMGPIGAAGLFAARCFLTTFPEPEIHLPPGTDMKLAITLPQSETGVVNSQPAVEGTQATAAGELLSTIANRLTSITYANGRPAPDQWNVVLLGSRAQITADFVAAGWSEADQRSWSTSSRVYFAFSSMRSYSSAPVSTLLYRGAPPELVFEKSFDTVTQRHHVRFWSVGEFDGQTVWLGAATHDSGIAFRPASFKFTHKIDGEIDLERDKVGTDLNFAGCAQEAMLISRPAASAIPERARVSTDGKLLVLSTQPCEAQAMAPDETPRPGNRLSRLARRVVLETRNYIVRDNAYYWTYRFVRSSRNRTNPLAP